jgi:hypothetical protein
MGELGPGIKHVAKNSIPKLNDKYKTIAFTKKSAHNYEKAQQFMDT